MLYALLAGALLLGACGVLERVSQRAEAPATATPAPTVAAPATPSSTPAPALQATALLTATPALPRILPSPLPTVTPLISATATLPLSIPATLPPPSPAPAPSPLPPPEAANSLTIWMSDQEQSLEALRLLAHEFASQQGVTIEVVQKPPTTMRTDLIAANLADTPLPDLLWGTNDDLAELLLDGQLRPVDDLVARDAFLSAAATGATYNGKLWGVPVTIQDHLLLLHNRALAPQPPATTDDLIAQSRALNGPEQFGFVAAWSESRWLLAWLHGMGGAPTTPDGLQPTLNTPPMLQALDLLVELHKSTPPAVQSYADMRGWVLSGRVAVAVDGAWAVQEYQQLAPGVDLGVAPMPLVPATGRRAAPPPGGSYLMLPGNPDRPPEQQAQALRFAQALAQPEAQRRTAHMLGRLPALRSLLNDPLITSDVALAAAAQHAEEASGLPPTKALRCAVHAIDAQLPPLLAGNLNQQQAAEAMQQAADACMAY